MPPKLKVGDTFIYTKEMNDAKLRTTCSSDQKQGGIGDGAGKVLMWLTMMKYC